MLNNTITSINSTPATTTIQSNNNTPNKRTRESPGTTDNQEKKTKCSAMSSEGSSDNPMQYIMMKLQKLDTLDNHRSDVSSIKTEISSIKAAVMSIESNQKLLNERINSLSHEVITISSNQKITDSNVICLSTEVNDIKQKISQIDIMKNQLDQDLLKNDISVFGIPSSYVEKPDELLCAFNQSLDLTLTKQSFKFIRFMNKKKSPTCNVFMRFGDSAIKSAFMTAVAGMSKNADGKREPITVEDIFEEFKEPSNITGLQIHFSNSL